MKNLFTFLACGLASGHLALAQQVSVEVSVDGDQYLANEALEVNVRVINRSGQTLHLGKEPDWLTFTVSSYNNRIIPRYGEVPVVSPFVLENGERGTLKLNVAPYFGMDQPGRYRIIASVNFRELGVVAKSEPIGVDIIRGVTLWSQEFGVPKRVGEASGLPEVRKYTLQKLSKKIYLRVSDPPGVKVFKVVLLDGAVSSETPKTQLDKASNLHLLYRTSGQSFYYWVTDPDGDLLLRQTHVYNENRPPKLEMDRQGNVQVKNGARQLSPTDFPKLDELPAPPAAKPPTP